MDTDQVLDTNSEEELHRSLKIKTNDSPEVLAFFGWFNHFVASIKSAAFWTGLELAVWGKIAEGHCTAEVIAAQEGWDVDGIQRLLNMLVSIGLLSREADEYVLVPEAALNLVPGKPTYMGSFLPIIGPLPNRV